MVERVKEHVQFVLVVRLKYSSYKENVYPKSVFDSGIVVF